MIYDFHVIAFLLLFASYFLCTFGKEIRSICIYSSCSVQNYLFLYAWSHSLRGLISIRNLEILHTSWDIYRFLLLLNKTQIYYIGIKFDATDCSNFLYSTSFSLFFTQFSKELGSFMKAGKTCFVFCTSRRLVLRITIQAS